MMPTETRDVLVEKITTLKSEGLSRKDIANRLNGDSLKTPAGKDWTDALVGAFMTRHEITKSSKSTEKREVTKVMETSKKAKRLKTSSKRKAKTSARRTRAAVVNVSSQVVPGGSDVASEDRFALFATIVKSDLMSNDQKIKTLNTLI